MLCAPTPDWHLAPTIYCAGSRRIKDGQWPANHKTAKAMLAPEDLVTLVPVVRHIQVRAVSATQDRVVLAIRVPAEPVEPVH